MHRYAPAELPGLEDDPRVAIRAWRSPAAIREAAKSFVGKPIVKGHPPRERPIDPSCVAGVVCDAKWRNGRVEADLIIWSPEAIEGIRDGSAADLSAGYRLDVVPSPLPELADIAQVNLRADHVALVDKGRNGSACSLKQLIN